MGPSPARNLLISGQIRLQAAAAIGCLLTAMHGRAAKVASANLHEEGQQKTEEELIAEGLVRSDTTFLLPTVYAPAKVRPNGYYARRMSRMATAAASRKRNRG